MFAGFTDERVDVGEVELRVRHGGDGPPVLLVHGHPRTGATWHRVAPLLVDADFTVVCPDMRGYGRSGKATVREDHAQQSKRAVAAGTVSRLVVMDGVPISEALARCDAEFARRWYHWFFLAQPELPERVILADPEAWYAGDPERMGADNHREFREATRDPETVLAMIEDYRAGLGVDREHEEADRRAGHVVRCPTLFVWSTRDDMEELYGDPLAIWRNWAPDVRGVPIDSGHHIAEENPEALGEALIGFLSDQGPMGSPA